MHKKSIIIEGNSVAVRVRPHKENAKSYFGLFDEAFNGNVITHAHSGRLIGHVSRVPDKLTDIAPTAIIIHFGVNEMVSRSVPLWLYRYLFQKEKRTYAGAIVEGALKLIEAKGRSLMVNLRFRRSWYRLSRFINTYDKLLEYLQRNAEATIICIGISTPDARVEGQLPGSRKRIAEANKQMEAQCKDSARVHFVSVSDIASDLVPDGIHFNAEGHKILFEKIKPLIPDF